jgi:hypothetical protein
VKKGMFAKSELFEMMKNGINLEMKKKRGSNIPNRGGYLWI